MANAEVGSLRVRMGLDAAEFRAGVKQVTNAMGSLESSITSSARKAIIHVELLKQAFRVAFDTVVGSMKRAIDEADNLGKLAQSIGVAVEDLSRLKHAAALSNIDMAEFRTGIVQLTKSMDEAKDPMSEGGRVFAALGINVRNANGQMRPAAEVLSDLAGKFARFEDGVNKTAIAVALFGKSGDKMIPMLNAGAQGLRDAGDEADRFGITISERSAKAAELFNDTITRLNATKDGFAMRITARVLPSLQAYADQMLAAASNSNNLKSATDGISSVIEFVSRIFASIPLTIQRIVAETTALINLFGSFGTILGGTDRIKAAYEALRAENQKTVEQFAALKASNDVVWSSWFTSMTVAAAETPKQMAPIVQSVEDLKQAMRTLKDEQKAALDDALNDDTETAADKQLRLNAAVEEGLITRQQYGQMSRKVADQEKQQWNDVLSQASSTLGALFGESKAVAIAQALINTYQGVSKAIATYPPPIAQIMAGLQLAAGMAQVANIRKTTKSSTGGGTSGVSSGATAVAAAPQAVAPQQTTQAEPQRQATTVSLSLRGSSFGREQMRELFENINEYIKDGGRIHLVA